MNFSRGDTFYDSQFAHPQNQQRMHTQGFYPLDDQAQPRYDIPRYNDRMPGAGPQGNYGGYDMGSQTWNGAGGGFGSNTMGPMGASNRMKPSSRGRAALPPGWLDQPSHAQTVSPFHGLGGGPTGPPPMKADSMGMGMGMGMDDEDLIPTAIVIKNIPFAVKKEQLVAIMTDLGLPLPYAFNYHFDNGIFRGLAFANFTSADETATVIDILNHYDLQGRKLRVEYKKMLPAAERERIEREKRERRGQLEEQHRPLGVTTNLPGQTGMSSMPGIPGNNSPSPVSARGTNSAIDMNDGDTLEFYTKLTLFRGSSDDVLQLPPNLTPHQRRIVHTLAHHMNLAHVSKGVGDQRAVHVYKQIDGVSPVGGSGNDPSRRNLSRAATTEFHNDSRSGSNSNDNGAYALRPQNSAYLAQYPQQNASNLSTSGQNLRAAKSFADLRSYTPSPVPSTASFPASLSGNVARMQDPANREVVSATTAHAPANNHLGSRDDSMLVSGLGNLNLTNGFGNSPRAVRGMNSWDRVNISTDNLTTNGAHGAIGGHRSFASMASEEQGRERTPVTSSRSNRSSAFPRQSRPDTQGKRASDELSRHSGSADLGSAE